MNAPDVELAMFKVHAQTSRLNVSSLPFKVAAGDARPKEPQFASVHQPACPMRGSWSCGLHSSLWTA